MYKLLLISHYLRRKLAPLFAALAVTLCTAMVIIVISVMGGFLDTMRGAAQKLTGPVSITSGLSGFPHYEEFITQLEANDKVETVTPVIRSFALLKYPHGVYPVEVVGIEPDGFNAVTGYYSTLYWGIDDQKELAGAWKPGDPETPVEDDIIKQMAMRFALPDQLEEPYASMVPIVPGIEVNYANYRATDGKYTYSGQSVLYPLQLTVMPLSESGSVAYETEVSQVIVVNEFKSGLANVDAQRVYVPFAMLQKWMKMERVESDVLDDFGDPTGEVNTTPARTNELMIKGKPGVTLEELRLAVVQEHEMFGEKYPDLAFRTYVETWEQRHSALLDAVQNEKGLITFLFAIISVVAFVMVATTFYNIVLEKTRDIGTLRALGAPRAGIAGIFLGYGLTIGILGGAVGVVLAVIMVHNLNELNTWLCSSFNLCIWNPQTYYFDEVPEQINPTEVFWISVGAVISSVMGSLIPAAFAARLNPIDALRYE